MIFSNTLVLHSIQLLQQAESANIMNMISQLNWFPGESHYSLSALLLCDFELFIVARLCEHKQNIHTKLIEYFLGFNYVFKDFFTNLQREQGFQQTNSKLFSLVPAQDLLLQASPTRLVGNFQQQALQECYSHNACRNTVC